MNNNPKWTFYSSFDSSHWDGHFGIKNVQLQSLVLEISINMKKDVFTKYLKNQWLKLNVLYAKMFVSSRRVEWAIERLFWIVSSRDIYYFFILIFWKILQCKIITISRDFHVIDKLWLANNHKLSCDWTSEQVHELWTELELYLNWTYYRVQVRFNINN